MSFHLKRRSASQKCGGNGRNKVVGHGHRGHGRGETDIRQVEENLVPHRIQTYLCHQYRQVLGRVGGAGGVRAVRVHNSYHSSVQTINMSCSSCACNSIGYWSAGDACCLPHAELPRRLMPELLSRKKNAGRRREAGAHEIRPSHGAAWLWLPAQERWRERRRRAWLCQECQAARVSVSARRPPSAPSAHPPPRPSLPLLLLLSHNLFGGVECR